MLWKFVILSFLASDVGAVYWNASNVTRNTNNYRAVAYYVDWAIYRNFYPGDLPGESLTHVHYAFANISSDTGEVYLADPTSDTDIPFPGDSSDDSGNNLYGCLKQLYLLKKQNRNLKVLLSIGGWTFSSNFVQPASTPYGRSNFTTSVISLVSDLGFDGVDIDWEYPADDDQANNMAQLLRAVRQGLDEYGQSLSPPYHFELVVASPAGASSYQKLHLAEMDQYVDFWNLMAYDYTGSWSTLTGNQANLFPSTDNPASTPFNTQTAIKYYQSQGIEASKIVLGMPIYGRSFLNTDGLGMPFEGVGPGTWELGVYDFKDLPLSGATEFYNATTGSSYSYDFNNRELISYDNLAVSTEKAQFIRWMGLGGAMWWESSADGLGDKSLIKNVVEVLGGTDALEITWNQLDYPNSTYNNLRAGMPDSSLATSLSRRSLRDAETSFSTTVTITLKSTTTICATAPIYLPSSDSKVLNSTSPTLFSSTFLETTTVTPNYSHASISSKTTKSTFASSSASAETTFESVTTPLRVTTTTTLSQRGTMTYYTTTTTFKPVTTPLPSKVATSTSPSVNSDENASQYGSGCISGGTCETYHCVNCPTGDCFCGLDASGNATCFQDQHCQTTCSKNSDCGAGKGCVMDSCCGSGGYCISLAQGPDWCGNEGTRVKRDHGGGWDGIYKGSWSCQAYDQYR